MLKGEGELKVKTTPNAGFAPAPGALRQLEIQIQSGMRENGVQVSYKVAGEIVRMAYHSVPLASMQNVNVGTMQIGPFHDKVGPDDHLLSGSGPAIIEYFDKT
jgi:hypothetical protein